MKEETKSILFGVGMIISGIMISVLHYFDGNVMRTDAVISENFLIPTYLCVLIFILFTIGLINSFKKMIKRTSIR